MKHTLMILAVIFFSTSCTASEKDYAKCGIKIESHYQAAHNGFIELTVLVDQISSNEGSCAEITSVSVSNYEDGELFQFSVYDRKAEFFVKISRNRAFTSTLEFSLKNELGSTDLDRGSNYLSVDVSRFLPD